jgi:hypothetical protein
MGKRIVLLCAVGGSDLDTTGTEFEASVREGRAERATGMRMIGEDLLKPGVYERFRESLTFPIVTSALEWVLQNRQEAQPVAVYLSATDQTHPHHRLNDTVGIAEIMCRWLPERYADLVAVAPEQLRVTSDVIDYGAQYAAWQGRCAWLQREVGDADVVVCVTGGIPAVVFGMLMRATQTFRGRCSVLYVPYDMKTKRSQPAGRVPIDDHIWREEIEAGFRAALHDHHYAQALALVDIPSLDSPETRLIVAALQARVRQLEFDFGGARRALDQVEQTPPTGPAASSLVAYLVGQQAMLGQLMEPSGSEAREHARVIELFRNASIQYAMGHYADALARHVTLLDALTIHLCSRAMDFWPKTPNDFKPLLGRVKASLGAIKHPPWKGQIAEFIAKIDTVLLAGRNIDDAFFRYFFDKIVPFLMKQDPDADSYKLAKIEAQMYGKELMPIRQFIGIGARDHGSNHSNAKLNELRNECQIAHGFKAVTPEVLKQRYSSSFFGLGGDERTPAFIRDMRHVLETYLRLNIEEMAVFPTLLIETLRERPHPLGT